MSFRNKEDIPQKITAAFALGERIKRPLWKPGGITVSRHNNKCLNIVTAWRNHFRILNSLAPTKNV